MQSDQLKVICLRRTLPASCILYWSCPRSVQNLQITTEIGTFFPNEPGRAASSSAFLITIQMSCVWGWVWWMWLLVICRASRSRRCTQWPPARRFSMTTRLRRLAHYDGNQRIPLNDWICRYLLCSGVLLVLMSKTRLPPAFCRALYSIAVYYNVITVV